MQFEDDGLWGNIEGSASEATCAYFMAVYEKFSLLWELSTLTSCYKIIKTRKTLDICKKKSMCFDVRCLERYVQQINRLER